MGKQICLGSPHRTHTNPNKHTHTHTHPSSPYPKLLFPASGPQEPGAASRLPGTARSWKPRGKALWLGDATMALPLLPWSTCLYSRCYLSGSPINLWQSTHPTLQERHTHLIERKQMRKHRRLCLSIPVSCYHDIDVLTLCGLVGSL